MKHAIPNSADPPLSCKHRSLRFAPLPSVLQGKEDEPHE